MRSSSFINFVSLLLVQVVSGFPFVNNGILRGDLMYPSDADRFFSVHLWQNGEVPYTVSTFNSQLFLEAMQQIQTQTDNCIRFVPRTSQSNFIKFTGFQQGCWSWIGKQPHMFNGQEVNIGPSCYQKGVVIHEILHAVGLLHEQTRPDRDAYIQILWQNIATGAWQNFNIEQAHSGTTNSEPYDYSSVMHYGPNDFAIYPPFTPTMIPRHPNVQIGQKNGLSDLDVKKLKKLYKCL